jgi:hypothetical protein
MTLGSALAPSSRQYHALFEVGVHLRDHRQYRSRVARGRFGPIEQRRQQHAASD